MKRFDVSRNRDRFNVFEVLIPRALDPVQKLLDRPVIGGPSVRVADRDRKKLEELFPGFCAGARNKGRLNVFGGFGCHFANYFACFALVVPAAQPLVPDGLISVNRGRTFKAAPIRSRQGISLPVSRVFLSLHAGIDVENRIQARRVCYYCAPAPFNMGVQRQTALNRISIRGAVPLCVLAIDSPEALELGFHQALDWWLEAGLSQEVRSRLEVGSCPEAGSSQEVSSSYPETG